VDDSIAFKVVFATFALEFGLFVIELQYNFYQVLIKFVTFALEEPGTKLKLQ